MKKGISILFSLCGIFHALAQPNLVPNPSFEQYTDCPSGSGDVWYSEPWASIHGTVDYYHECGINGWSVPQSLLGGGDARTGQAYVGMGIRYLSSQAAGYREYLGLPLLTSLKRDSLYKLEFYVSLGDSTWFAGKDIGVYFSAGNPIPANTNENDVLDSLLLLVPQVNYTGNFLTDKVGWTQIERFFTAQGGENFLTIGNFNPDSITETLFVEGGGVPKPWAPDYWKTVYYFIDDVSVIPVDSLVGVEATDYPMTNDINVYPNPANDMLTVDLALKEGESGLFELWNITGALMKQVNLIQGKNTVDVSTMLAGMYFYSVRVNLEQKLTGKQIIVR